MTLDAWRLFYCILPWIFSLHVIPSRLNASFTFFPFSIKTRWFLSRDRSNEKITFSAYSVFFKCFSCMPCSICNKDITKIRRHSISNSMLRSICILTEEPYNFFLFMVECRNATAMASLQSLCKTKRCVCFYNDAMREYNVILECFEPGIVYQGWHWLHILNMKSLSDKCFIITILFIHSIYWSYNFPN